MSERKYKRNCEVKEGVDMPLGMSRVALALEYNGAKYQGFQRQVSAKTTVQGELEQALSYVADESITLVCAGRTDAGVHATRQVVHFDTLASRDIKAWVVGVNSQLSESVRVCWAQPVAMSFHARFSATARVYRYFIASGPVRPALLVDHVSWCKFSLDAQKMHDAAQYLVGEHDFTSYRTVQCQAKNPVRTVEYIHIRPVGQLLVIEMKANAFLHHMIRNIVGVLMEIGRGAKPIDWSHWVLEQRNRCCAAATAQPHGLYFVGVDYPDKYGLDTHPTGPAFIV